MKSDKIVFIDTETGGIDPLRHSLLSIGLVIWKECKIIDQIEILINDGILNVTSKALEINKINLQEHKQIALKPLDAIKELDAFLNKHFSIEERITLGGHNINFDVNFLKGFLNTHNYNFQKRFSYRYIDTASILYFLYLSDKLNVKLTSSEEAFTYFNIKIEKRHTALGDAIATSNLFNKLLASNELSSLKSLIN